MSIITIVVEDCNARDNPVVIRKILRKFAICRSDHDIHRANQIFDRPVYTRNPDIINAALERQAEQIL